MEYFWNLRNVSLDSIAFIETNGCEISYGELIERVKLCKKSLPKFRSLVFLQASNDISIVCWYLACLQLDYPVLLVDATLEDAMLSKLIETYNPNVLLGAKNLEIRHTQFVDMHPELALMLSTSGTTGSPKLVRLSKKNIQSNADSICEYLSLCSSDTAITTMPLHYSYGLSILNSHLNAKAKTILTEEGLLSRCFWQLVADHSVTSLAGVPYIWQMLKKMRYDRFNTNSIRYITQAGGRLDTESLKYFREQTAKRSQQFIVMYGQTEATARIAYLPDHLLVSKIGSIGIAIPNGKLWIKTEQGTLIDSPNITGELVYHGPNVMLGYAECLNDLAHGDQNQGILETGDIGYCDDDGFFYITGRAKRFIKIYGLRLSLDAVDEILSSIGLEAVSTGNDDKLVVFVVGEEVSNGVIAKDLADKLKININSIHVRSVKAIPRNSAGKPDGQAIKLLMDTNE